MYKISVPIMNMLTDRVGREVYLEELKRLDAERVFLCEEVCDPESANGRHKMDVLRKNTEFFKSHGYEVGCWSWAFNAGAGTDYTYMVSVNGVSSGYEVCPTDEKYIVYFGKYIEAVVGAGVDIIMLDDDYRFGFMDMGVGCTCQNHIKMMEDTLGEKLDRSALSGLLTVGKPNRVRDAWIKANGQALENFAAEMRARIDRINPDVRFGYCTCMTNWDIDGTSPDRLARIMAGRTIPFYRLIGAPYWASKLSWGNRLSDVIELERMEKSWNTDDEIEIFSEGDAYPRPRFKCPAAYIEGFDTALRADGRLDGILKYGIDYTSNAGYETGYQLRHELHRGLYREISEMFDGKEACGIRVYESPKKISVTDIPTGADAQHMFFSYAARCMAACAVPTVYDGVGCGGVVFGSNAHFLPDEALEHGLIIDIAAAKILAERGIDVGIEEICGKMRTGFEYFLPEPHAVSLDGGGEVYCVKTKSGAVCESYFTEDMTVPGSFRYENADGQKFLVLCFDGYFCAEELYRQYTRAEQIIGAVEWFGAPLPAVCKGQPDLYLLEKTDGEGRLAVGLWNFSVDDMPCPIVKTDRKYTKVETIGCTAEIVGNEVRLSYIAPFGFAGLLLS